MMGREVHRPWRCEQCSHVPLAVDVRGGGPAGRGRAGRWSHPSWTCGGRHGKVLRLAVVAWEVIVRVVVVQGGGLPAADVSRGRDVRRGDPTGRGRIGAP